MIAESLVAIANIALTLFAVTSLLALGMGLTAESFVRPLRDRRSLILVLVASFILVPLLVLAINLLLPLAADQRTALLLLGTMAGAPFLPLVVQMAKGHLPLAAGHMAVLVVVTIIYAPLVLPILLTYVEISFLDIAIPLFTLMLLPLIIGLLLRSRYSEAATQWQPTLSRAATYSMFLMFAAGVPPALPGIIGGVGSWIIPATVLLTLGAVLIGYTLARGISSDKRKTMALATGQRNMTGALVVAADSFSGDTFVMTLIAAIVLQIVMLLTALEWGRRTREH